MCVLQSLVLMLLFSLNTCYFVPTSSPPTDDPTGIGSTSGALGESATLYRADLNRIDYTWQLPNGSLVYDNSSKYTVSYVENKMGYIRTSLTQSLFQGIMTKHRTWYNRDFITNTITVHNITESDYGKYGYDSYLLRPGERPPSTGVIYSAELNDLTNYKKAFHCISDAAIFWCLGSDPNNCTEIMSFKKEDRWMLPFTIKTRKGIFNESVLVIADGPRYPAYNTLWCVNKYIISKSCHYKLWEESRYYEYESCLRTSLPAVLIAMGVLMLVVGMLAIIRARLLKIAGVACCHMLARAIVAQQARGQGTGTRADIRYQPLPQDTPQTAEDTDNDSLILH